MSFVKASALQRWSKKHREHLKRLTNVFNPFKGLNCFNICVFANSRQPPSKVLHQVVREGHVSLKQIYRNVFNYFSDVLDVSKILESVRKRFMKLKGWKPGCPLKLQTHQTGVFATNINGAWQRFDAASIFI